MALFQRAILKNQIAIRLDKYKKHVDYFHNPDREIYGMIYALYGLTEEEIGIIEGGSK